MDYIKLGESLAVLLIVLAGIVVLVIWISKQNKKGNRDLLLIKFRNTSFKDEAEMAWFIAHDVVGAANFEDCVVYRVEQSEQLCRQIAAFGPKNPVKLSILNPITIPFGRGIVGHVATSGIPEKIDNTTLDKRYVPDDDVRYSELSVPVMSSAGVVMVIDAERKRMNGFTEADGAFFLELARIASMKHAALSVSAVVAN